VLRLKIVPWVDASLAPSNDTHQLLIKNPQHPTQFLAGIKILYVNITNSTDYSANWRSSQWAASNLIKNNNA